MEYTNFKYVIVAIEKVDTLDFRSKFLQSRHTLRLNNDKTKAVVKYEGDKPSSITETVYTHEEILQEFKKEEWAPQLSDETKELLGL